MSRSIHRRAHRTGLVSADIFRPGVDDLNQLGKLAPNDIWDGTLIHVRDLNGIYAYDLESVAVDDGLTVITPATAVGRWLQIGFGGTSSATSGTADKWIDVTKITASETITVDPSLANDHPREVRRDNIDVEGILDVLTDGYVLSGDYPLEISGQTQGDVLYFDGSSWVRLAAGTVGEVLQTGGAGANPTWEARPALLDRHHINMPAAPGATVKYRGWSDGASRLTKAKFYHGTASTAGVIYTLAITNETNGTSLLAGATEDLLVPAGSSVTLLGLAATGDLVFAENDQWEITIVMDVNINAADIYVDLVFESI